MTEQYEDGAAPPAAAEPEALNPQEDLDLVALMNVKRERERFYLPTRNAEGQAVNSDRFFIEVKPWSAADHLKYNSVGMEYSVTPTRTGQPPVLRHKPDPTAQARALIMGSITDFCLPSDGVEVKFAGAESVWAVLSSRNEMLEWAAKKVRQFHGIEVVATSGEASPPAS